MIINNFNVTVMLDPDINSWNMTATSPQEADMPLGWPQSPHEYKSEVFQLEDIGLTVYYFQDLTLDDLQSAAIAALTLISDRIDNLRKWLEQYGGETGNN